MSPEVLASSSKPESSSLGSSSSSSEIPTSAYPRGILGPAGLGGRPPAAVVGEEGVGPVPFERRDLAVGVCCLRAEPPPPVIPPPTTLTCSACFLELMCLIQAPWLSETVRLQLLQCFLPLLLVPGVAEPGIMGVESSS